MRVVLDANVWISALLVPPGAPGRLVGAVLSRRIEGVITRHLWQEVLTSFAKERIQRRLAKQGLLEVAQLVLFVVRPRLTDVKELAPSQTWVPGDTDDDWVVQCALTAGADRIVTGDKALLGLQVVEGIKVVTARELLDDLEARERVTKRP